MNGTDAIYFIALGGALGAIVRYTTQELFAQQSRLPGWVAIGLVNLSGCLLLGLLQGTTTGDVVDATVSPGSRWLMLWVSFCGGLTTFSTFSLDNLLLSYRYRGQLAFNLMGSLFGGWGMVLIGLFLSHHVF